MMIKKQEFVWKKSYTLVLVANALYIIGFYLLMSYFS